MRYSQNPKDGDFARLLSSSLSLILGWAVAFALPGLGVRHLCGWTPKCHRWVIHPFQRKHEWSGWFKAENMSLGSSEYACGLICPKGIQTHSTRSLVLRLDCICSYFYSLHVLSYAFLDVWSQVINTSGVLDALFRLAVTVGRVRSGSSVASTYYNVSLILIAKLLQAQSSEIKECLHVEINFYYFPTHPGGPTVIPLLKLPQPRLQQLHRYGHWCVTLTDLGWFCVIMFSRVHCVLLVLTPSCGKHTTVVTHTLSWITSRFLSCLSRFRQ